MLAIAGGKGGCGKTTTTHRLGRALAELGASPLLVDADVEMPDLHSHASVPPDPGLPAVAQGDRPRSVAHTPETRPNLAVLPSAGADPDDLTAAASRLREWPGPVLLDCPAGALRDAARPLRVADRTLLVTTPRPAALGDAIKTAAMAAELDAPAEGAVIVETTPADDADRVPTAAAREALTCPVSARISYTGEGGHPPEAVRSAYRSLARKVRQRNI
ncbi:MinD/ParA family ATP-binding protein [Halorientalis halophila]|uniref:MinD/ParA family ATP-binding protein n=1 Tax=Halorientalis halophila TaxID=3108499 RepID=UPI00300BD734